MNAIHNLLLPNAAGREPKLFLGLEIPCFETLVILVGAITSAVGALRVVTGWELVWLGEADKSTPS